MDFEGPCVGSDHVGACEVAQPEERALRGEFVRQPLQLRALTPRLVLPQPEVGRDGIHDRAVLVALLANVEAHQVDAEALHPTQQVLEPSCGKRNGSGT